MCAFEFVNWFRGNDVFVHTHTYTQTLVPVTCALGIAPLLIIMNAVCEYFLIIHVFVDLVFVLLVLVLLRIDVYGQVTYGKLQVLLIRAENLDTDHCGVCDNVYAQLQWPDASIFRTEEYDFDCPSFPLFGSCNDYHAWSVLPASSVCVTANPRIPARVVDRGSGSADDVLIDSSLFFPSPKFKGGSTLSGWQTAYSGSERLRVQYNIYSELCSEGYYTSACSGSVHMCALCSHLTCDYGYYRTGDCGGSENGYQCVDCDSVPSATCATGTYRTGVCGGTVMNYTCEPCGPSSGCPSEAPTVTPSGTPTFAPTCTPTFAPSRAPTITHTNAPTGMSADALTHAPIHT